MKQLSPQDAQFLFMEDGNLASHVTSIMICDQSTAPDGIVRFKDILSTVENRLGNAPMYSQKLMRLPFDFDFPYWVEDPHFELEYHVRHGRLPEPSDWRQLCIHISRFHSRPLDMARPPWEIYIIEGLDNVEGVAPGSFAMAMKMHHAAVDGTSAQKFMFSMMDLGPSGPPIIPPPSGRNGRDGNVPTSQLLVRAAMNNYMAPAKLANAALKMTPKIASTLAGKALKRSSASQTVPMTRFNGETSPNRAFDAITFELEDFKNIAKSFEGGKINDAVLAVSAGALRRYLKSKNELPKEPLVITAPVNKRKDDPTQSSSKEGNDISAMSLPIFTNIADPTDRMKMIIQASQTAKSDKSTSTSRMLTDLSQHIPAMPLSTLGPLLLQSGMVGERMCNAIVSNVPGVQIPLYFCGAKITNAYGMAPIGAGVGLFIATPSYNGKLSFSITTTRQIMPDTPYFMNCLKQSLEEMKTAAEKKAKAPNAASRKTKQARKSYHRTRSAAEMATAKATRKPTPKKRPKKPR